MEQIKDCIFYIFCASMFCLNAWYPMTSEGTLMKVVICGTIFLALVHHAGVFDQMKIESEREDAELS